MGPHVGVAMETREVKVAYIQSHDHANQVAAQWLMNHPGHKWRHRWHTTIPGEQSVLFMDMPAEEAHRLEAPETWNRGSADRFERGKSEAWSHGDAAEWRRGSTEEWSHIPVCMAGDSTTTATTNQTSKEQQAELSREFQELELDEDDGEYVRVSSNTPWDPSWDMLVEELQDYNFT